MGACTQLSLNTSTPKQLSKQAVKKVTECVVENRSELSAGSLPEWCKTQVYTVRGKVISKRPINRSDTQTLRHMFLISSGSNNIMVEESTAAVISRYQRLTLVWRDSRGGLMGLKPPGTWGMKNNYVRSQWVVQAGGMLSAFLLKLAFIFYKLIKYLS